MYQPLTLDQLRVDSELARLRHAALDRRGSLEGTGSAGATSRRRWWPRPRRSILRLAFAGIPSARGRHACVDC